MHLIIGGAYQGKLEYAKKEYGFSCDKVFSCTDQGPVDFSYPCIIHIEEYVYGCVKRGDDPLKYFEENRALWENSVLICRDISSGIVPIKKDEREWREKVGILTAYLSKCADRVSRIFCGVEQRIK